MPELRLGKNRQAMVRVRGWIVGWLEERRPSLFRHAVQLRALRLGQLVLASGFQVPSLVEEIGCHHLAGGFCVGGLGQVEDGPVGQLGILE